VTLRGGRERVVNAAARVREEVTHLWQGGRMVAPSGEQYEISGNGYRAVVTESGASLRVLEYDGRPLVLGFGEDETSSS
jgi:hypothetical protein